VAVREDTYQKEYMKRHKGRLLLSELINQHRRIVRRKNEINFKARKRKKKWDINGWNKCGSKNRNVNR
jgi:hypothetical protein